MKVWIAICLLTSIAFVAGVGIGVKVTLIGFKEQIAALELKVQQRDDHAFRLGLAADDVRVKEAWEEVKLHHQRADHAEMMLERIRSAGRKVIVEAGVMNPVP